MTLLKLLSPLLFPLIANNQELARMLQFLSEAAAPAETPQSSSSPSSQQEELDELEVDVEIFNSCLKVRKQERYSAKNKKNLNKFSFLYKIFFYLVFYCLYSILFCFLGSSQIFIKFFS